MAVSIRIPTPMRNLTGGASEVSVEGATLAEALKALDAQADIVFDMAAHTVDVDTGVPLAHLLAALDAAGFPATIQP